MDISRQSLSVGIFTWLLQYFPKNRTILVQKLWGEKKLSKSVFGYFKTKKKNFKKDFKTYYGEPLKTIKYLL